MSSDKSKLLQALFDFYSENNRLPSANEIANMFNIGAKKAYWLHGYLSATLKDETFIRQIEKEIDNDANMVELVISDLHIPYIDEKAFFTMLDFVKGMKDEPNIVCILGDLIDFYQISFWNRDPKKVAIEDEIEIAKEYLSLLRKEFPNAQFFLLESNHHLRMKRYLFSKAPELSGLAQLMFENLLSLSDFNIRYVSNEKFMTINQEPFKIGNLYHIHGHELRTCGINVARNVFLKTQHNTIMGHWHVTQEYIQRRINGEVYGCWAVGCLCSLVAEYAPVNQWNHGFAIVNHFGLDFFEVRNYKIINGKVL